MTNNFDFGFGFNNRPNLSLNEMVELMGIYNSYFDCPIIIYSIIDLLSKELKNKIDQVERKMATLPPNVLFGLVK